MAVQPLPASSHWPSVVEEINFKFALRVLLFGGEEKAMGKVLEAIDDELQAWVEKQQMFFVASAPLAADGHVNCSPKGIDSLRITGRHEVIYQDLTGSAIETVAHVRENGRIVIMLCAFEGGPRIVRFHGAGQYIKMGTDAFASYEKLFKPHPGCRAFVKVDVHRISSSCGYAVPLYDFAGQRDVLDKWTDKKDAAALDKYRRLKNSQSIDGLPGLDLT